jgi:DNA-binding CsgD family transcriptional regulator/pimeloyl-ACP methyl ester carboxylesterase
MEVSYDREGTGMSSPARADFGFESQLDELEAVVDYLRLPVFALLCGSAATMLGIAYSVRHPERVSHLICVNGSAHGQNFNVQQLVFALDALLTVETGWEICSEALPQLLFSSPQALALLSAGGAEWNRTSAANMLALWTAIRAQDVSSLLRHVQTSTMVIHRRGDNVVHIAAAVELASNIPGARFLSVEGSTHHILRGEESGAVRRAIVDFLSDDVNSAPKIMTKPAALTHQQLRVMRLIAEGRSSREMADALVLSERTVQRHIANLYTKIGVRNRAEATAYAMRLAHS